MFHLPIYEHYDYVEYGDTLSKYGRWTAICNSRVPIIILIMVFILYI